MKEKKKKSGWGVGIFVFYGLFMVFILALVLFVSIQDIQLVEDDYYAKDLKYQEHIDKLNATSSLTEQIQMKVKSDTRHIIFDFPSEIKPESISGTIFLVRPSNARLDTSFTIELDDSGIQTISTERMARGNWRVRIDWQSDTLHFFNENVIFIQ